MQPAFNAFFLMTLGVPSVVMMVYNLKKEESQRVNSLGKRSIGTNNSETWLKGPAATLRLMTRRRCKPMLFDMI